MKKKLLTLLVVTSLVFVGCSKTTVEQEQATLLVTDIVETIVEDNLDEPDTTAENKIEDELIEDITELEDLEESLNDDTLEEDIINEDTVEEDITNEDTAQEDIIQLANKEETNTQEDVVTTTDTKTKSVETTADILDTTTNKDTELLAEQEEIIGDIVNEDIVIEEIFQDEVFVEEIIIEEVIIEEVIIEEVIIEEVIIEPVVEATDGNYSLDYNLTGNIDIESHVFDQVNELRTSLGIAPLTSNNILVGAALTRAKELPLLFSHTRPNGTSWFTIFEEIPYRFKACGENLTTGSGLTREQAYNKIFDSWYNSPGHYANMVNPDFKEIGITVYFDENGTYYATQIFGTEFD